MADIIQVRRDTAANWSFTNPILADGEFGLDKDNYLFKIGNGIQHWNDLSYYGGGSNTVTSGISIYNETPSGIMDGVNRIFTTQFPFVTRTTRVYKNTLKLTLGASNDYTESGPNQINILCILRDTDIITINYEKDNSAEPPVLT